MALTERTRPYETMIRHNADGSVGSHHIRITEVLRDGVVINASTEPPQPLDGAGLEAVIGTAFVQATAQITATQAAAAAAQASADTATQQLASANATLLQRDATITALSAQVDALQALLDAQNVGTGGDSPSFDSIDIPEAAPAAPEA